MKKTKKKSLVREVVEFTLQLMIVMAIAISISSGVCAITGVIGPSMENTLHDSEKLCIDRISYGFSEPQYGDIVIFLKGETIDGFIGSVKNSIDDLVMRLSGEVRRNRLVKRVIGLPGDIIQIEDNKVFRNNILIEEEYIKGNTFPMKIDFPLVIPEGKVFVMGDNRENSNDSRAFGVVDYKSIEGKVILRVWPFSDIKVFNK